MINFHTAKPYNIIVDNDNKNCQDGFGTELVIRGFLTSGNNLRDQNGIEIPYTLFRHTL